MAALVAVLALGYGAIFVYANVINDSPDELDESDLAEALEATTTVATTPTDTASPTESTPAATDPAGSDPSSSSPATSSPADSGSADPAGAYDGDWVPTDASEFGYRVEEVLAGVNTTAVGRSNEISGLMTIAGRRFPLSTSRCRWPASRATSRGATVSSSDGS